MRRAFAAPLAPEPFRLDRDRFASFTREHFGEVVGVELDAEDGIVAALYRRFADAFEVRAILGPAGVEPIVYALRDSVIVAVREEDPPFDSPIARRQLATYSVEVKYVLDRADEGFEAAYEAIEELLSMASELLPSCNALRRAERARGGHWLLRIVRRLRPTTAQVNSR